MADIDLTVVPWDRLARLAPPGTNEVQLQAAASRHSTNTDIYAAAADLWEEAALLIDLAPDETGGSGDQVVSKVSQDGITVEYASDALAGNNQSSRQAQYAQYMANARRFRKRSKPTSPLVHSVDYNPWVNTPMPQDDCERIIVVDEV